MYAMQTPNINVKAYRRPHLPSSERRRTRERTGPSSAPTETLMRQFMLRTCAAQHHAGSDVTEASDSTEGCQQGPKATGWIEFSTRNILTFLTLTNVNLIFIKNN